MREVKVNITGTLDIEQMEARGINLMDYVYIIEGKEPVSSVGLENKMFKIPRNFTKFGKLLSHQRITPIYTDSRVTKEVETPLEMSDNFALRDYQKIPVRSILTALKDTKGHSCILKAEPGFGKSYILPYVIKKVGQRALIIVDRTNLRDQMYEEFITNLKDKSRVQVLTNTTKKLKDINITTAQLLLKNKKLIRAAKKECGIVVVDEAHIISIGAFTGIVNNIPAKYRLGLSATPSRSDGLTEAMFDTMGDRIVTGVNPNLLGVKYLFIKYPQIAITRGVGEKPLTPVGRVIKLFSDPKLLIDVATTAVELHKKGRAVLLYATYNATQTKLREILQTMGYSCGLVNKDANTKAKMESFKAFNDRKIDFLVTGVTSNKGVSIHRLDTIINISNHTKESFEQLAGRLRRDHTDKKDCLFIDFLFLGAGMEKSQLRYEVAENLKRSSKKDKVYRWSYDKFYNKFIDKC